MPSLSIVRRWREAVERLQRLLVAISVTGRAHATCCVRHCWEQKHWANLMNELRDWAQNFSSAQTQMKTDDTKEKEKEDGYAA